MSACRLPLLPATALALSVLVLTAVMGGGSAVASPAPTTTRAAALLRQPVPVEHFGAVGDGVTDDTAALQRALDAGSPSTRLVLASGRTYLHSDVLHVRVPGERLTGAGTLMATVESRSSVWVEADGVVIDGGMTIATASTTRRWEAWEQMGLRLYGHVGAVVRDVTVSGSAAAGVYVGDGASGFLLQRVTVRGSRADGIHMTGGAHDGRVLAPLIVGSGDDGVAVVSYEQDGAPCHDITVSSPRVSGTVWGRGVSVVGGTDITYSDVKVERSSAAAVYIAEEGAPWNTTPPVRVRVLGATLVQANTDSTVDHGAVVVLAAGDAGPRDVLVQGVRIVDTRSTASRDVGVITYATPPSGVVLRNVWITGGPASGYSGNTPGSAYSTTGWWQNGVRLADHTP